MAGYLFSVVGSLLLGAGVATALLLGRLRTQRRAARMLQGQLDDACASQAALHELRTHLSGLRHDIRGILSPAMLVADRLISHKEPAVRRAGEVMVRTVERAAARLSESPLDQEPVNISQH